ncbi:YiiG family protein [Brucella sp. BE17]|uniref:YiiG family protein n=1 Tax=Brucella sp. BE17 TaxID=3142977 RepID=UPI0031B9E4CC
MKRYSLRAMIFSLVAVLIPTASFAQTADDSDTNAAIEKMNAYVSLLNRTIRASESLNRYESWVNMKKGPTGKERIVYGLYSLYDVRKEIETAQEATAADPKIPELDAAMVNYIAAYQKLAPVIEKANKYYERKDYMSDKYAEAKVFHKQIVEAAPDFLKERKRVDALVTVEKGKLDLAELAALEKTHGKKASWHVRNVMIRANAVIDLLPDNDKPVVDMDAFGKAMDAYAGAVREMDDYATENPNSFHVFESRPASLLGKLRGLQEKLTKTKGDARKGNAASDLQWIVNDYNLMVSTSQSATIFSKE